MVYKASSTGKGSPSSMFVNELNNYAAKKESVAKTFSLPVAINQEREKAFTDARDETNVDCLAAGVKEQGNDWTTSQEHMKNQAGDKLEALYESARAGCADLQGKCKKSFPDKLRQVSCISSDAECNTPIMERQGDGIDYIFEFVESAICGEYCGSKTRREVAPSGVGGKGMTFKDLADKMPQLRDVNFTEDESIASKSARTSRSHRTTSTRSRGRSTASKSKSKSNGKSKSQRKRSSDENAPKPRSRSLNVKGDNPKKKETNEKVAENASAFIRANVKPSGLDFESGLNHYQDDHRIPSLLLKPGKGSAFDELASFKALTSPTADSTAFTSNSTGKVTSGKVTELRELCVLSIGSGSSVSSFDEDGGHSWSRHMKDSRKCSSSPNSVLTAITTNTTQKKGEGDQTDLDKSIDSIVRGLKALANFIHSLSLNLYGYGVAAPVNKAFCLLSITIIFLFWPEDREKARVRIERAEIPKKTAPASLLTLVTQGATPKESHGDTKGVFPGPAEIVNGEVRR